MTTETVAATITVSEYTGEKAPFVPGGITLPAFELLSINKFGAEQVGDYEFDAPEPIKPTVVVNIETTGVEPFDSRITAICARDALDPNAPPITFLAENEEEIIKAFISFFEAANYSVLVGYNIAFDLRFMLVKAMAYGLSSEALFNCALDDVAETMKQVRHKYTFGYNKPYKLANWAKYFFDEEQPLDIEGLLTAWGKRDYAAVKDYVERQVNWTYNLWAMAKHSMNELQPLPDTEKQLQVVSSLETKAVKTDFTLQPQTPTEPTPTMQEVLTQCTNCLSETLIPEGMQTTRCLICGEVVTR